MYKKNESLPSLQIHPYAPQFHYGCCCFVINVFEGYSYIVSNFTISANDSQNLTVKIFRRNNADL